MAEKNKDTTSFREAPFLVLKGFLMGSADIVPGVSGGTMALIVGIYERLLNAIKSVNGAFIKDVLSFNFKGALEKLHFWFLIFLFGGIFSALAFFTKVVPLQIYMFTHPEIVFGLFFGLILGSIYILIKTLERFRITEGGTLVLGVLFGFWIVSLVPADTPEHPLFVFLSGCIAICAMILPGISGSYLLLIMRKYDYILSQVGKIGGAETLDGILALLPFLLGAIVGLAAFSRFLSWLLGKYHSQTISVLIGFLIGSLFVIWPYQHREFVESVSEVQELEIDAPLVQDLMQNGANENLPEFKRLAAADPDQQLIKVETVKKKMIKSEPYVPGWIGEEKEDNPDVWGGVAGIFIGIILVGGLDQLRKKS